MPMPIAEMPSVVMNDGIFSPVDSMPLARPKHAPSADRGDDPEEAEVDVVAGVRHEERDADAPRSP